MTGGEAGGARPPNASSEGSNNLIHRNNSPKPRTARAAARLTLTESNVSEAVLRTAFGLFLNLRQGAYERTS